MARIFEALERAEQEFKTRFQVAAPPGAGPGELGQSLRDKLIPAYQHIEAQLGEGEARVITFIGGRSGDGASILVREFAKVVGSELGRRVVLLGAPAGLDAFGEHFGVRLDGACEDVASGIRQLEDVLRPIVGTSLFLGCLTNSEGSVTAFVLQSRFGSTIQLLRERFDYILLDASGARNPSDALALAGVSDGVIVIVEAERTRWQAVQNTCESIVARGGKILGVILNKKRHHIPGWIYDRL